MGFSFKHHPEDALLSGQAKGSAKRRCVRKHTAQGSRPKDGSDPAQDTNSPVGHTTTPPEVHSAAEPLDTATARDFDEIAARPASTAAATSTTCPPCWFAQHLPGHERDRAFWASALPDQESGLHVPLKLILAEKLRTVARLTRWYECVVEREQADKRVATAARASAARGSNAAVADEVTEAKAAVSRFEDAALAARERLGKMTEDSSEPSSGRLGALSQISAETSRDLAAAQRRLEKAEDRAIEAANLVRADAAAKAAADIAAAAAEVDAAAEARAAGIDEPAAATSAEIGATITRAKLAVDHYLGIGLYCTSHMSH